MGMDSKLSRRAFLTGAAVVGVTSTIGLVACSPSSSTSQAAETEGGVFEGRARGLKSEIAVSVSLADDGSITSVAVTEQDDSPFIVDAAIAGVTSAMVEHQTLEVDTVSGATWSSRGIIEAAKNALAELPDSSRYATPVNATIEKGSDAECDVVIIGGGASGLSAAASLRTDASMSPLADSGLNVILVDQLGYTGGCIRVSDVRVITFNGTRYNDALQIQLSTDDMVARAKELDTAGVLNEELLRTIIDTSPAALDALLNRGLYMPVSDARVGDIVTLKGPNWNVRDPLTGENGSTKLKEGSLSYASNAGGPWLAQSLEQVALDTGADIRKSTQVKDLVMSNGVITAVNVVDTANKVEYAIRPKQIIFATGCLGADLDRTKKYAPTVGESVHFGSPGTTGDGLVWIEESGGVILDGKIHYQPGPDSKIGHYGPVSMLQQHVPCIMVNLEGQRFFNDGKRDRAAATTNYVKQKDNKVFGIVSGKAIEDFQEQLDYALAGDVAWKADTLDDLAQQTGIDAQGLQATVEEYNKAYEAGEGVSFDVTHELMTPIAENGPYYAFLERTLYNLADISIKVDAQCQPIKADGTPVFSNAHAAGSMIVSNYGFMCGGLSHVMALTSGYYVGNLVRTSFAG